MRNIQETIIQHERFISEKQDLVYLLSHDLKNFAGQPQALANFIIDTNFRGGCRVSGVNLSIIQASVSIYRKLY
jgi:hypothetical protein